MLVDLQGVKVDRAYLLTDPALHSNDLLRFRETRTNLGVKGMRQFFRSHVKSTFINDSIECIRVGTGRIFSIRSGRNPAGSFLTSNWQKSGGIRQNHQFIQ